MVRVKEEGDKFVVEFRSIEYYMLLRILEEVSKYSGTGTALMAKNILQKLRERDGRGKRV